MDPSCGHFAALLGATAPRAATAWMGSCGFWLLFGVAYFLAAVAWVAHSPRDRRRDRPRDTPRNEPAPPRRVPPPETAAPRPRRAATPPDAGGRSSPARAYTAPDRLNVIA